MIPTAFLQAWSANAPWPDLRQVEQDLIICRALCDPWAVLLQAGAQLVSALSAAGDVGAAPHPWLERDPATGACSLRLPLPPPQTARRLADALSVIADSLRGTRAGE